MSMKTDTADAVKIIADAAAEASKTIASAAAEALKVRQKESGNDHDLIIQLNTKVDQIQADVNSLKTQDKNNITQEQHQSLVTCNLDHEKRIRDNEKNITRLMTWGAAGIVVLGIAEFLINKFL